VSREQTARISAFIVCFNEADQIEECLESLSFCDEVIVVDSFSTDNTIELAQRRGAKVVQRAWPGFREQKAYGLSLCSNEWVLNLDADERVSEELRASILKLLDLPLNDADPGQINGYYISRVVYYLGRWWRKGGWYPEFRLRLLRKSKTVWGGVDPHEKPIVSGKTERIEGELLHYTYDDLHEQLQRMESYSTMAAREDFERGKKTRLFQLVISPVIRALKFYLFKRGYREGTAGLIVAIIEGYYTFMKYAKLWEMTHRPLGNSVLEGEQGRAANG
jgi:glycosyltransferase involved in cell wall biosynthesis